MNRSIIFLLLAVMCGTSLRAAEQSPAETKLRESLRNTMLQLRGIQAERDTLLAEKADNEQKLKSLADQLDALKKEAVANQSAADKNLAGLKAKLADDDMEIAQLREDLEKWKAAQKQAADVARAKEAARAQLASEAIVLKRRIADQQTKNAEMFKVGSEILTRYERFGLGTALTAREPFIGTTRVKLETLVQDYQDKLTDQKVKP
jgi:chromosome segregation ATPase